MFMVFGCFVELFMFWVLVVGRVYFAAFGRLSGCALLSVWGLGLVLGG